MPGEFHPDPLDNALAPAQAKLVAKEYDLGVNLLGVDPRGGLRTPHRDRDAGILQGEPVNNDATVCELAQVERKRDAADLGDEAPALVAVMNRYVPREKACEGIEREPPDRDFDGVAAERARKGFLRSEPDPFAAQIICRPRNPDKDQHQNEAHGALPQKMNRGMDFHRPPFQPQRSPGAQRRISGII